MSTHLANVEDAHRESPRAFSIPRGEQRRNLHVGQLVKLVFLLDVSEADEPRAERMWVEVKEVTGNRYIGSLENDPRYISNLKLGDIVEFGPEHVAALYREPEEPQIQYGKTAIVSRRILTEKVWPRRLVRKQPANEMESGWWIFSDEKPEPSDSDEFLTCSIEEII